MFYDLAVDGRISVVPRAIAQLARALAWGARGRRFKSG